MMKRKNELFKDAIVLFLLICIMTTALLELSPILRPVPHRDSGIFIYGGSEILRGKVLYREAWDDKQPLIFYLDALGLWLGNGSYWGIWLLELLVYLITFTLLYVTFRKKLTPLESFMILGASFMGVFRYFGGNYTEEFAVCFELIMVVLLFAVYLPSLSRSSHRLLACFVMGVLAGLAYCLKQTYIDVALTLCLFIAFIAWAKKDRKVLIDFLLLLLGFFAVNMVFFVYFYRQGALSDYWRAAYLFNGYYTNLELLERVKAFLAVLQKLIQQPTSILALLIWIGVVGFSSSRIPLFIKRLSRWKPVKWVIFGLTLLLLFVFVYARVRGKAEGMGLLEYGVLVLFLIFFVLAFSLFLIRPSQTERLLTVVEVVRETSRKVGWSDFDLPLFFFFGFFDLLLVLLAISLSGRMYSHYFITLLPAFIFLLSLFVIGIRQLRKPSATLRNVFLCLMVVVLIGVPTLNVARAFLRPFPVEQETDFTLSSAYVRENSYATDKILMWGYDAAFYYLSEREAITRYFFQYPAYFVWPQQTVVQQTIYNDLVVNPPRYVVDTNFTHPEYMPLIEGRTMQECLGKNPSDGTEMQKILNFICSNYVLEKAFGDIDIYRYQPWAN